MGTELATPAEIVARIEQRKPQDMFGFEVGEYVPFLPFAEAKPYLKEGTTEAEWDADRPQATREEVLKRMRDYMDFAWEKANNQRGLSAGRSISHYVAWLWLIGERELSSEIENYEFYGKPQLARICERFGWDAKQWDDGERTNG